MKFFILNQVWGINFITEGFADFCSKKSFITNVQLFLLYRCVRKWFFPKYCPHFFFYNFDYSKRKRHERKKDAEEKRRERKKGGKSIFFTT